MERYILNLGLYQIALMPQSIIDAALIHGLVERWRSETHSFHLPVGEMTVTLQDVSALWGLRIDGVPIGGVSDSPDYLGLIEDLLGMLPEELQKKRTKNEEESKYSEYHLSLAPLREHFKGGLSEDSTDDDVQR